ncbi:MAG TPA: hypothetical protein VGR35_21065 [Tepidisphaeraceae bacterium]|nr:hypothetical protein [Tepidisphaeraceae bacterium]
MKYKTLFRLHLKVIGVLAFVFGTASVMSSLGYLFTGLYPSSFGMAQLGASLFSMAMGLYLFFGGKWIADKAIPGNRPYCHECGYDLTNAAGCVCSECGTPFRPAETGSAS